MAQPESLNLTDDPEANRLLVENPLALLIGMLLDQQVPMERAFAGPQRLRERLGRELDAASIAAMDPDELEALFRQPPAIHRFPGSMARRVHDLCSFLVEHHDGQADAVWRDARSGQELYERVAALPGFGRQKAQVFVALLGKQLEVRPEGWEQAAGEYGQPGYRSVADITDGEALQQVREYKRLRKGRT